MWANPATRIEPRYRAGMLLVAFVYGIGYIVGSAHGRSASAAQILRAYAREGPQRSA